MYRICSFTPFIMWSSLFYLRMSHWNASSGKWRSAVPWKQRDTRIQWADWRRKSRHWKRRWQGTCRSTRISSMSNWLWILRLPHTGSSWRERRAGELEFVSSDLTINHSMWYWFLFIFVSFLPGSRFQFKAFPTCSLEVSLNFEPRYFLPLTD